MRANDGALFDVNRPDSTECNILNITLSWLAYYTVIKYFIEKWSILEIELATGLLFRPPYYVTRALISMLVRLQFSLPANLSIRPNPTKYGARATADLPVARRHVRSLMY